VRSERVALARFRGSADRRSEAEIIGCEASFNRHYSPPVLSAGSRV